MGLIGIDVAGTMLKQLVAKAGHQRSFPLMVGDATALPIANRAFGAVLFSHVLHLFPEWKIAVDEAVRIMRPGGALLVDFGGGASTPWSAAAAQS